MKYPLSYVSPSQITSYLRCPMQFFFSYVANIKMKPLLRMTKGSGVHKGVEISLKEKLVTGRPAPDSVVEDAAVQDFRQRLQHTYLEDTEAKNLDKDTRAVATLAKGLNRESVPVIEPVLVEEKIGVALSLPDEDGNEIDVDVLAYPDAVTMDARIVDFKVRARKVTPASIQKDIQLNLYKAVVEADKGIPVSGLEQHIAVDSSIPEVQRISIEKPNSQEAVQVAAQVATNIMRGQFYPRFDWNVCSWCGYRRLCWEGRPFEYIQDVESARKDALRFIEEKKILGEGQHDLFPGFND